MNQTYVIHETKLSLQYGGQRLDKVLANIFPQYSRSKIKSYILNHQVKIDGNIVSIPKKKC